MSTYDRRTSSEGNPALGPFADAFGTAKAAWMAAQKGNERLACLQGLGTIQNMTAALAGLAPEHADALQAIGAKAMRLLPLIKAEAAKEDVLHKARFEAGKPADPTSQMSPEDAQKWKDMNEKHRDNFKSADAGNELKTVLARLAVAKKAVSAVGVSEAQELADLAREVYKETHDLFDEAHRTKANYYDPIDPKLVDQLKGLHGRVLRGLKDLSRIDSKGLTPSS